ncbi:helix-turn-helix transcriptional regulator [Georgenia yuyongxinii]
MDKERLRPAPIVSEHLGTRAHLTCMENQHRTENAPAVDGLEPLLGIDTLAAYLGVPVATIYDWRVDGKGPCAIRIGRHLKFLASDVQAWVAQRREVTPGRLPGGGGGRP